MVRTSAVDRSGELNQRCCDATSDADLNPEAPASQVRGRRQVIAFRSVAPVGHDEVLHGVVRHRDHARKWSTSRFDVRRS